MARALTLHCLLGAIALAAGSCAGLPKQVTSQPVIEPCGHLEGAIARAMYNGDAEQATRSYLECSAANVSPQTLGIERRVNELLAGGHRGARFDANGIAGHFFDRDGLKTLPACDSEAEAYLLLLQDQSLSARAVGDVELAAAIDEQASRMQDILDRLASIRR